MKTHFSFSIFATLLLCCTMFFASCDDEETPTDLTTELVGTYTGTLERSGGTNTTINNAEAEVSKLSDTRIQIEAPDNSFHADLTADPADDSRIILTVPSQDDGYVTVSGTGSYTTASGELSYNITKDDNGITTFEDYTGTK